MYNLLEFASNSCLATYLQRTGGLEESVARFYFRQLVSAVGYMHDLNVAHLDIKPQNILLDENFNVKLADFGIAQMTTDSDKTSTKRRGTNQYMAPEVEDFSRKDAFDVCKADVYSLGVTLYVMLYGSMWENGKGASGSASTFDTDNSDDIKSYDN